MTAAKLELKTTFAFQSQPLPYQRHTAAGILIQVESDCVAQSSRLASDLDTALQYGAFPAAHALLINKIQEAETQGRPLTCTMEYGM